MGGARRKMSSATGANSSAARDTPGGMFVLRFDDLCPTMNWAAWDAIEQTLMELQVKPILAVVPDNRDNKLRVGPSNERFWERMRACQTRGWTVALHGYQHTYVNRNPGILGIWPQSEFAGLPAKEQERKILTGLQIFLRLGDGGHPGTQRDSHHQRWSRTVALPGQARYLLAAPAVMEING
jgi:hypothetical protein